MTKTFVYLCRPGPNEELRYSLRSVDYFYPDSTVWVVGGKPKWYSGNFISVGQTGDAFRNVALNLSKIVASKEIPEDIIIMNDDFFFLEYLDTIPSYISGTLKDRISLHRSNGINSSYVSKLMQSYRHCKAHSREPLDFDIHVPMPVKKSNLAKIVNDPVMWRSNYGNQFADPKTIEKICDVKVYSNSKYFFKSYDYASRQYPLISTHDDSFEIVHDHILKDMFSKPSRYESSSDAA